MQAPSLRKSEFFTIEMRHVPTSSPGKLNRVKFEGWVTEFADQFTSQWNEEHVYGRMDPLPTFEYTSRKIQLGFDIVSDNAAEAQRNLIKVNKLITFLYPVYDSDPSKGRVGNTLKAAPLIQMRWTNLLSNASDGGFLTGFLRGANYNPRVEDGGFVGGQMTPGAASAAPPGADPQLPESRGLTYVPKTLNISLDYTVLHTHLMGWTETNGVMSFAGGLLGQQFPNANVIGFEQADNQGILTTDPETGQATNANAPGNNPVVDSYIAAVLNPDGK
jgi:hypothetical protein